MARIRSIMDRMPANDQQVSGVATAQRLETSTARPAERGVATPSGSAEKTISPAQADQEASLPTTAADPRTSAVRNVSASPIPFSTPRVLEADVFELRSKDAGPAAEILIDQPKPDGLVFSVQLGAFRNSIPAEVFGDVLPMMGETTGNGLTRYTAGLFTDADAANNARDLIRHRGDADAFVVAYVDGRRIPMIEAREIAQRTQPLAAGIPGSPIGSTTNVNDQGTAVPAVIKQPSQVATTGTELEAEQASLAKYPATAQEIIAQFAPLPAATT